MRSGADGSRTGTHRAISWRHHAVGREPDEAHPAVALRWPMGDVVFTAARALGQRRWRVGKDAVGHAGSMVPTRKKRGWSAPQSGCYSVNLARCSRVYGGGSRVALLVNARHREHVEMNDHSDDRLWFGGGGVGMAGKRRASKRPEILSRTVDIASFRTSLPGASGEARRLSGLRRRRRTRRAQCGHPSQVKLRRKKTRVLLGGHPLLADP